MVHKVESKKEIDYIIKKLKERGGVNKREERAMRLIIDNIERIMPKLTKTLREEEMEEIKKEMKEIIERKGDFMSNFEKAIIKIVKENKAAKEAGKREGINIGRAEGMDIGRAEGMSIGKSEGKKDTICKIVRKMLNNKMKDEEIMEYVDITKEELEKLKLQIV